MSQKKVYSSLAEEDEHLSEIVIPGTHRSLSPSRNPTLQPSWFEILTTNNLKAQEVWVFYE